MIISDLNYLEAVTEEIVGGNLYFSKNITSAVASATDFNARNNVTDTFQKLATINVASNVKGNSSDFSFDNEAVGQNSSTEGTLNQITIAGVGSSQNGTFTSAANY